MDDSTPYNLDLHQSIREGDLEMDVEASADASGFDMRMRMQHPRFAQLVDDIAELFREEHGVNYVCFECRHPEIGELVVTIQRKDGKTPAQIVEELKAELATLRLEVERG